MEIQENISLKDKNWFQTGGNARFYCEPQEETDFIDALKFAKEKNLEAFILGEGANVLISDEGFDGLVIRPRNRQFEVENKGEDVYVTAGAGMKVQELIDLCLDKNIGGLEEFSGIPGTVGGSVFINIHYFEFLLSKFLVSAKVLNLETLEFNDVDNDWFRFGYDYSKLSEGEFILISATFKCTVLLEARTNYEKGRSFEIIRQRNARYPKSHTCGSFFRNFKEEDSCYPNIPEINGRKMIYIAYYLDKLGVKGDLKVGNAIVSSQHANMLVNQGGATSHDIIQLAQKMQSLVEEKYGFKPVSECVLVGFKENPLF